MALATGDFDYELPDSAIAQQPIEPRDSARLLVGSTLEDRTFRDLPELLHPGDLVVVNRTRVRAARLEARRASGGAVEVLLLDRTQSGSWTCLVRPARKIKTGETLKAGALDIRVLVAPVEGVTEVHLSAPGDVEETVASVGEVPLPPYIRETLADPERYQTIFAESVGSAAAPTAGLHFTDEVVAGLLSRGVSMASVELSVGLDTFRPIATESVAEHQMHSERCAVPSETARAIATAHAAGARVVAIGTTVVRTLESAAVGDHEVAVGESATELFITPGFEFRVVDALVTNFHAPRTTLIVMIAAFIGERWRDVYEHALASGYRFLSFGDAMLLEPEAGDA
ncbi:MAG: tRNA preQ1(34) S-adenosylmethionine ribosyltransferase-isomerase QueA [Acidimicrobiia bacterium]|nr:tRNA preQ1(34) S-adenosylmethionine ribosyltransferase-isomerase QueA [Acidimicrobiia bacterium]